jgi:hypothetical protein
LRCAVHLTGSDPIASTRCIANPAAIPIRVCVEWCYWSKVGRDMPHSGSFSVPELGSSSAPAPANAYELKAI